MAGRMPLQEIEDNGNITCRSKVSSMVAKITGGGARESSIVSGIITSNQNKISTANKGKEPLDDDDDDDDSLLFGKVDSSCDKTNSLLFIRNPSRLTSKAVVVTPSNFPGGNSKLGFVDLIRRASNACYACKSVACDGKGVHYTLRQGRGAAMPSLVWIPDRGSNLNGSSSKDCTILDTIHTDLINNFTGEGRVTPEDIKVFCYGGNVKHLFLNKFGEDGFPKEGYSDIVEAIRSCTYVETFACTGWTRIPASIFQALGSSVGKHLKGLHIMTGGLADQNAFYAVVQMLHDCTNLVWLGFDAVGRFQFTPAFFEAMPKSLKVLYIRSGQRVRCVKQVDPECLGTLHERLPNLKIRLIFPDSKFDSL